VPSLDGRSFGRLPAIDVGDDAAALVDVTLARLELRERAAPEVDPHRALCMALPARRLGA
jgi:hypothetical protein